MATMRGTCGDCKYWSNPRRGFAGVLYGTCSRVSRPEQFDKGQRGAVVYTTWADALPCEHWEKREQR